MMRVQIRLREGQIKELKALAAQRHTSVAALVRQAVDDWLRSNDGASQEERKRRAIAMAGRFRSGRHDISADHDRYLAEAFEE